MRFVCVLLSIAAQLSFAQRTEPVFEHRVVLPTTSLDRERDVEESLTRNVNQLAILGFEVGAIIGGHAPLLDRLLDRQPYVPGSVDHGGQAFVIMHRPNGLPVPAREYRFLHTRTPLGVQAIVTAIASEGFRLTITAWEGEYFHAVFERTAGTTPVEYRVFRTQFRRGWDQQMLSTPELKQRITRVIPMTLDSALVELGAPQASPAEFVWESDSPSNQSRHESRLNTRAAAGFRVQIARMRGNILDVALLKPAGASGPAPALDLNDGPWGMPCSKGKIAGADIWSDGDVYCVVEDPTGPVSNRGFDMVVAPEAGIDGQLLFGQPSCEVAARLSSARGSTARIARAFQLEREINRLVQPGYRVTRAFAGIKENTEQHLVFFTSRFPLPVFEGKPAPFAQAPPLIAQLDGLGQQLLADRENKLNASLATELGLPNVTVWAEINDVRLNRHVLLLGCAAHQMDRERAETVLRGLLARTPYSGFRIRNQIRIDLFR